MLLQALGYTVWLPGGPCAGWSFTIGAYALQHYSHDIWAAYASARCAALGLPMEQIEEAAEQRAAAALKRCLGLGQEAASYYARRCILFHRDRLLHEALAIDLAPHRIPDILSSVTVVGADQLQRLDPTRGIVLVSLHYGLYSSMLMWRLAQATVNNLFRRLTALIRSNRMGQYMVSAHRLKEFEDVGVWSRDRVELFDRDAVGSSATARALLDRLSGQEAVLIFPDGELRAPSSRALRVSIGHHVVGLAGGAAWLAKMGRCAVVPVYIRSHADSAHALVFGPPVPSASPDEVQEVVAASLQYLINQTIMLDPSPWQWWFREGLTELLGI